MCAGPNPIDTSDPMTRLRNFSTAVGSRNAGRTGVVDMNIWITGAERGCRVFVRHSCARLAKRIDAGSKGSYGSGRVFPHCTMADTNDRSAGQESGFMHSEGRQSPLRLPPLPGEGA